MTQFLRRTFQMVAALAVLTGVAHAQTPLTILTPNGGEIWPVGVRRDIVWSGSTGGNIRIDLSRDGGLTFPETLFSNTRDDGVQTWDVAGPSAPHCRLRLTSLDDPTRSAVSSADFAIVDAVTTVTVTSPNGGETWLTASDQLITWAAPGDANIPSDNVRIEISRDGGATFETLFASTPNDGMEPWTVHGPATACLIRVTSLTAADLTDTSDAAFSISSDVVVTAPNGGETWPGMSQQLITWTAQGSGDVKIELTRDGGLTYETLFASTPNDGSEPWTVTGPPASCRIRISHVDDPSLEDSSDGDFVITSNVTVTAPAGGEIWVIGTQQQITWTGSGTGDVSIELSRNGGPFETIFDQTPNDGAELWTVQGPVTNARIRVTPLDDPTFAAESQDDFFITQTPGVIVVEPNGGDVWTVGSRQFIRWNGVQGGEVSIELSRDDGLTWETLFARTANDGIQSWVVTGPESQDVLIRVTRLTPPFASDTSDAPLEITTQPLTLIAPQGGDDWVIDTQKLIRWGGTGVGSVGIDLSRDAGNTWETIIPSTPNDGAQFWTVTGPPTTGALIRIVGLGDLPGIDFSQPFTISTGTIDLTQPNGGERWAIGSSQGITWNTTTGGSVSIELSRDGGDSWETVFANTPNDGSEPWTVTGPACSDCLLRVTNLVDPDVQDGSTAPFAIFCSPSPVDIGAGQTRTGALGVSDCDAPDRPGSRGDLYTFTMPQTGVVTINVSADAFDPYVILVGPDNSIVAQNDNFGISKDARLDSLVLPAGGPYTIEVTSSVPGGLGLYRVSLSRYDIKLLTPLGGEVWKLGERRVVSWRSGAPDAPVDITLFRDGDLRVGGEPIALGTANDGSEGWIVTPPASAGAVVRVCVPEGNLGTSVCDVSGLITIAPCTKGETRACYDGPQGTLGVGVCRAGSLVCGDNGVFGNCQGETVPTAEVCGDNIDQDCNGSDITCVPCPGDGCADDDPCTADACVNGGCQHERPAGFALLDCRQTALTQALQDVTTTCQGDSASKASKRFQRKLGHGIARVEKIFKHVRTARNKRRCVAAFAAARQLALRLGQQVDAGVARNLLCQDASTLLARRISDVSAAIISLSSCDTTTP